MPDMLRPCFVFHIYILKGNKKYTVSNFEYLFVCFFFVFFSVKMFFTVIFVKCLSLKITKVILLQS